MWIQLSDVSGSGALYQQLYDALREAILRGDLRPGSRLPSTRALAADVGVSRNTVVQAYDQLRAEGYLTGRWGSGTYVSAEVPDRALRAQRSAARAPSTACDEPARLSAYGERICRIAPSWAPGSAQPRYDFRYASASLVDAPHETLRRIRARRARQLGARELDYGPPAGAPELREAVCEYLGRSRSVSCTPEQVVIVNGSQQALDLAARVLLNPGERAVLGELHYAGARGVLHAAGARLVPARVDDEGLDVSSVGASAGVRLIYTTPSHQFPTGVVMSLARRLDLLAFAERVGAYVLEDGYDSEYRYRGRPVETLQGIDRGRRVIYTGTFSRLLYPALRLGYVVLPAVLVRPFVAAKALGDTGGPTLDQLVLADFLRHGHFERHLRRSRARNARRCEALLEAIERELGDRARVSGSAGGLHVLVWIPDLPGSQTDAFVRRARAAGIGVYAVTPHAFQTPACVGILLGYGLQTEAEIRAGIAQLAKLVP